MNMYFLTYKNKYTNRHAHTHRFTECIAGDRCWQKYRQEESPFNSFILLSLRHAYCCTHCDHVVLNVFVIFFTSIVLPIFVYLFIFVLKLKWNHMCQVRLEGNRKKKRVGGWGVYYKYIFVSNEPRRFFPCAGYRGFNDNVHIQKGMD